MELNHIPLEKLTVSAINVRTHGATDDLDALAASIRAQGILQPLLVRPVADRDGFEIVAGQRRFLACQRLAQDAPVDPLPCLVLAATDDAAALEISLAENLERLPMEPFDQYEAFARLVKRGQSIATLAARFGVTVTYDQVVSTAVQDAGGRAWVTEYAGPLPTNARQFFTVPLQNLIPERPYLTRMYTTVSVAAMDRDPEFTFVSGLPDVSNTHDLSAFTSTAAVFDLRFALASAALVGGASAWRRRRREAR